MDERDERYTLFWKLTRANALPKSLSARASHNRFGQVRRVFLFPYLVEHYIGVCDMLPTVSFFSKPEGKRAEEG